MTGRKKFFLIAAAVLCVSSCNDLLKVALDVKISTTPIVGGNGALTVSAVTMDGFTVSWAAAQEGVTPSEKMKYLVYTSTTNNISTVAEAEANGTPFGTMTENITSRTITGLDDNREHRVNVVVQDEAGNKSVYQMTSATTMKHPRIYWIERGNHLIRRGDLDGSNSQTVYDAGTGTAPYAIAIDAVNRRIYYTQQNSPQTISRVDFNGANRVDLITSNVAAPRGIALDVTGGKVYWSDYTNNNIYAAPLTTVGGDANAFFVRSAVNTRPNGIVLDLVSSKMYWAEDDPTTPGIYSADLNGTNQATVWSNTSYPPLALSIDVSGAWLYFTARGTSPIVARVKTNGSFFGSIISTNVSTGARGVAIDAARSYVYWTDTTPHWIYRAPSGTTGEDANPFKLNVDTSSGSPTGIEVY